MRGVLFRPVSVLSVYIYSSSSRSSCTYIACGAFVAYSRSGSYDEHNIPRAFEESSTAAVAMEVVAGYCKVARSTRFTA